MEAKGTQTINGKAFEYALLMTIKERLSEVTYVEIIDNYPYQTALRCFNSLEEKKQGQNRLSASVAVNFLIDIEPRLSHSIDDQDVLQLEIASDFRGQRGDVRDVLVIRSLQQWEIGVSAKHNHRAVKHSRLSNDIDFGYKWLNTPCSQNYFDQISPIFNELQRIKESSRKRAQWSEIGDYHNWVYKPILDAFRQELLRLHDANPGIAQRLVEYLIGSIDFYKIINTERKVEIQGYNLHGTLNIPFGDIKPKDKIPRLKFPTRLIDISYKDDSDTTLFVTLDEGWQISFRIHNASSRVEPSLKFDINLISTPRSLYSLQLFINNQE